MSGLVHKPQTFDIDDLVRKMPLEERLYRHRCVEAWSHERALDRLSHQGAGRSRPAPGLGQIPAHGHFFTIRKQRPACATTPIRGPYHEGLSMAEATNELSLFVTGIYGHELTKQHGAPIRLVVPWKYGL